MEFCSTLEFPKHFPNASDRLGCVADTGKWKTDGKLGRRDYECRAFPPALPIFRRAFDGYRTMDDI